MAEPRKLRHELAIRLALLAILLLGAAFRFYNVNWDKGTYHIHPDERYTTMVITAIDWPASIGEYFDTTRSPLNPRNADMVFFYGTFPLFLTKLLGTLTRMTGYDEIHLVGRVLSALFDVGTVMLAFALGRRLFSWRVGLAAAFLLALTVLNIQGSHYFAADTFLTFFATLTLWFTLDVAEGRGWPAFVGLGLSMGLTLACKVSVFLLVVVIVLGAWIGWRRRVARGQRPGAAFGRVFGGLAGAGLLALAVFRVAQPYAWAGPHYDAYDSVPEPWGDRLRAFEKVPEPIRAAIMPNPQWIADIVSAGAQQTGEADMPWGRQWTERAPWLYPLENMVLWGLGVPLGLAAWAGVAWIALRLVRAWRRRPPRAQALDVASPPPVAWAAPPGADSPRLPDPAPSLSHETSPRWSLIAVLLAWVLLLFAWQGMQFVKSIRYFLPIYPALAVFAAALLAGAWDWAAGRGRVWRLVAGVLAAAVLLGTLAWAFAFIQIYTEPITRVQASHWIYDNVPAGSVIANEHFDDPLPFSTEGRVAFAPGGPYRSLEVYYPGSQNAIDQLPLYDEDNPDKLRVLLDALDQADYIVMSSGRLLTSIPRLPMRYPMTTRYYELLLAGRLGFEKAAEFHSYPRLFGIEFNDDRAEEQFTVYDHPKVLIYHKTAAYDRAAAETLLGEGIDWGSVATWLNPRDVPEWKRTHERQNDLKLTPEQEAVQVHGGTWASIFDRNSLPNRLPTYSWYMLATILGLVTLPLVAGVLRRLPDRGYILARPVGVLLLAWLSWMLTNLTPLHYTRGTILLALGLIALASAASLLIPAQRRLLADLFRRRWRLIAVSEALFLLFFAAFWFIRWGNPDLWHPWMGGEKPMDFAYLNAVIKSTEFPPYDPWFAGGYLNYYYFGQVMVGTLIKLIGIVPAVAYNLTIPLWAAMTAMGAFSVTYNLVAGAAGPRRAPLADGGAAGVRQDEQDRPEPGQATRPYLFALTGALFVAVLGNLGEIHLVLLKVGEGVMQAFRSTIPGLVFWVRAIIGSFEALFGGKALPIGLNEWYWNASRAVPTGPNESVITEFPFFTFLYADLHAHLIALPLTFIALAVALAVVLKAGEARGGGWRGRLASLAPLGLWALAIGAMRVTNTWDVPPHLIVALGALTIAEVSREGRLGWRPVLSVAWQLGLLFVLSWWLLYRPFWLSYASFYNKLGLWTGTRTVLWAYLVVHGLFLFLIVSYLVVRSFERGPGRLPDPFLRRVGLTLRYWRRPGELRRAARIAGVRDLPVSPLVWVLLALLVAVEFFFMLPGRVQPDMAAQGAFAYRGLAAFALGLPLAVLGLLLLSRPGALPAERLWAYLVLLALAMSLGVEIVVLQGDIGRMNTVFKFYLQTWLIWGVCAAAALAWLVPRVRQWRRGHLAWPVALTVLLLLAASYAPLAVSAKIRDRFEGVTGPGLDGWAYMQTAIYHDSAGPVYALKWDLEAIHWLLDNVAGSPVILEGHAPEYRWGARYSINTGLPAVLGWNWHQRQQRAAANEQEVWQRADDIADMYDLPDPAGTLALLHHYQVRYVIVGPLERAYYLADGLQKFDQMAADGTLDVVFHNEGVTIYEVVR